MNQQEEKNVAITKPKSNLKARVQLFLISYKRFVTRFDDYNVHQPRMEQNMTRNAIFIFDLLLQKFQCLR